MSSFARSLGRGKSRTERNRSARKAQRTMERYQLEKQREKNMDRLHEKANAENA